MYDKTCNSLMCRAERVFGEALNAFILYSVFKKTALVMELCMEMQYSALAETCTVNWVNEVLKCFQLCNVEDIIKAVEENKLGGVRLEGRGLNLRLELGENTPKLLFYISRLFCIAARKYQHWQEPERAKAAYVIATLYISASAELLKRRKKTAADKLAVSLPILLLDKADVPDAYRYNADAAVESYFELSERKLERMRKKVETKISELT